MLPSPPGLSYVEGCTLLIRKVLVEKTLKVNTSIIYSLKSIGLLHKIISIRNKNVTYIFHWILRVGVCCHNSQIVMWIGSPHFMNLRYLIRLPSSVPAPLRRASILPLRPEREEVPSPQLPRRLPNQHHERDSPPSSRPMWQPDWFQGKES